jgi:hypothetical protein
MEDPRPAISSATHAGVRSGPVDNEKLGYIIAECRVRIEALRESLGPSTHVAAMNCGEGARGESASSQRDRSPRHNFAGDISEALALVGHAARSLLQDLERGDSGIGRGCPPQRAPKVGSRGTVGPYLGVRSLGG